MKEIGFNDPEVVNEIERIASSSTITMMTLRPQTEETCPQDPYVFAAINPETESFSHLLNDH